MENIEQISRPSWDEYFMKLAWLVAERSTCVRHHVGAVIVRDKRILTTGYNGAASGIKDCLELGCLRNELNIPSGTRHEICRAIHAEQNAIIQAGQDRCKGATMYIWGHDFICILCKRFIVQAGIKTVYLQKNEESPLKCIEVEEIIQELSKLQEVGV